MPEMKLLGGNSLDDLIAALGQMRYRFEGPPSAIEDYAVEINELGITFSATDGSRAARAFLPFTTENYPDLSSITPTPEDRPHVARVSGEKLNQACRALFPYRADGMEIQAQDGALVLRAGGILIALDAQTSGDGPAVLLDPYLLVDGIGLADPREGEVEIRYGGPTDSVLLRGVLDDQVRDERVYFLGVDKLEAAGIPPSHLMAYMLVGFDPAETWDRIFHRFNRMVERGIRPYPMVYGHRPDLKRFQRWAIRREYLFIPWDAYDVSRKAT